MMKALSIVAAAVLMSATGALAAAPDADGAKPEASEPAKKEKKVCRSEKMTGSLTRVRRVCLTESEWRRLSEVTRKGVDDVVRSASQTGGSGAGAN